jgi:hypothetical protein
VTLTGRVYVSLSGTVQSVRCVKWDGIQQTAVYIATQQKHVQIAAYVTMLVHATVVLIMLEIHVRRVNRGGILQTAVYIATQQKHVTRTACAVMLMVHATALPRLLARDAWSAV